MLSFRLTKKLAKMKPTQPLKIHQKMIYRCYKNFDIADFVKILKGGLEMVNDKSYKSSENIFLNVLNIYGPLKRQMLRFKNSAFIAKKLRKENMKRSKLKNNFNKNRNYESRCKFKTQRNYCVNFFRKSEHQYFRNRNVNNVCKTLLQ